VLTEPLRSKIPERIGRYQILAPLGEGGMGIVYVGEHEESLQRVAIKTVRLPDEKLLSGLRREIHALAQIRHPGIVRILEQGTQDGLPWVAMELLEGRTLAGVFEGIWGKLEGSISTKADTEWAPALTPEPTLAPALSHLAPTARKVAAGGHLLPVLGVFHELCVTLAFLHGEGIVHRDLKPENILLDEGGAPVLVDFGLAAHSPGAVGREVLDVTTAQGTVAYMAPEQILGHFVDARADLYAVGGLLYEAVTGMPPFHGGGPGKVLSQHLTAVPRRPSALVDGVPPALDELIVRLLSKAPRKRPGHAADIARALAALGAAPRRRKALPTARAYVYRPELVGRKAALSSIVARLERAQEGHGGFVLLRGESGIGKTYVALAAARDAAKQGFSVITGACTSVATSWEAAAPESAGSLGLGGTPDARLHPFRPFLQAVIDRCIIHGPEIALALLDDRGKLLAEYAPGLRAIPGQEAFPDPPELPAFAAHERLVRALLETLFAFCRKWPLLLILDDLQWADDLSLALLARLAAERRFEQEALLILGTYRAEETTPALVALAAEGAVHTIDLGRLDQASVGAMVRDMLALDTPPPSLVAFLTKTSDGNPFFVAEYLRTAVAEGLLRRSDEGLWEVARGSEDATAYERLPLPGSLRELVIHHLAGLSPKARQLALAASVIGREIEADLLPEVAELDDVTTLSAQSELLLRQICDEPSPGKLRFLHDKLREVAYAEIPAAALRSLHLRAGRAIEARHARSPDAARFYPSLAHHFLRAGETPKAMEYLEKAGTLALSSFANREAASIFRDLIALGHEARLGPGGAELGRDVSTIVDIVRRGSVSERDRLAFTRWERQLADAYFRLGETAGARHAALALAWARHPLADDRRGGAKSLLREIPIQAAHRLLPEVLWETRGELPRQIQREGARALGRLAWWSFYSGTPLRTAALVFASTNETESSGGKVEAARQYAGLSMILGMVRLTNVSSHYLRLARAAVAQTRNEADRAYVHWAEGVRLTFSARWDDALAEQKAALRIAERVGDPSDVEQYWIGAMTICLWRGDLKGAVGHTDRIVRSAEERGGIRNVGWSLTLAIVALARLGRRAEAEERRAQARKSLASSSVPTDVRISLLICDALLLFCDGDLDEAHAVAERAVSMTRRMMPLYVLWMAHTISTEIYLARWEAALGHRPEVAAEAARASARALRSLFRCSLRCRPFAPFYHLLRGRMQRITGSPRRARASLERAVALSREFQMRYPEAYAHVDLGRLEPKGSAARLAHLGGAEVLFEQMECAPGLLDCRALRVEDGVA
jgi:tetratricopeptide (TPR) repeat protein